jgi:hypothetical protein
MVVEMLANIDCLEASTLLVGDHEVNTLPQALKELADAGGWPATTASVLSNIATTCTQKPKTRTTPAEVLQQVGRARGRGAGPVAVGSASYGTSKELQPQLAVLPVTGQSRTACTAAVPPALGQLECGQVVEIRASLPSGGR